MNKLERIGITGWWFAANYGSVLTYYALYKTIERLGYQPILIDCHKERKPQKGKEPFSRKFMEKCCNVSPSYPKKDMKKLNDLCDAFIVGSDQVWTPGAINNMSGFFFFLDFADDSKKKIAYGPSFGQSSFKATEEVRKQASFYANRFAKVSVRETAGIKICKESFGVDAERVMDPVFLIDTLDYDEVASKSALNIDNEYILSYILDPTDDKRNMLQFASEYYHTPFINVLDGRETNLQANYKKMNLPNTQMHVSVEDWVCYFKNAKYVITDSHHGLAMALIYNKPVICYANRSRGLSRFESLLAVLGIPEIMVFSAQEAIDRKVYDYQIDYNRVNQILAQEKERCLTWLDDAFSKPCNSVDRAITSRLAADMCTGCSACVNACSTGALSLLPDEWGYYRSRLSPSKCINCGKCASVCPALQLPYNNNSQSPAIYAYLSNRPEIVMASTSGGVFTDLAESFIDQGGSVAGAAWKDDFSVGHIIVNNKQDLAKLRKSKYLQSYVGDVFSEIRKKLEQGESVMFSGCPCQVAGLKGYLGKEYENLLLIDLLCGNAPSAGFFSKYLKEQFPDGISTYEFRYKNPKENYVWKADPVFVKDLNGQSIMLNRTNDAYQSVYHDHSMCSKHCEKCAYQSLPRFGDLTIGDFWNIGKKDASLDTKKGISAVLCNNEKGRHFFLSSTEGKYQIRKEEPLKWLGGNGYALENQHNHASAYRDTFYEKILEQSFVDTVKTIWDLRQKPLREFYRSQNVLLNLDARQVFFRFDRTIWEEHMIDHHIVLYVKEKQAPPGKYAILPLAKTLEKGKRYILRTKFSIQTDNRYFNLHVMQSNGSKHQSIAILDFENGKTDKNDVSVSIEFTPMQEGLDSFMIGAAQICGKQRYIAFSYIHIIEK